MTIAICPGSFDPVTMGHMDIIRRAAKLFDKVVVLVMPNHAKTALFTTEERLVLIERSLKEAGLSNVEVDAYEGLLADYTRQHKASVIVKGLRAMSDFEYEFQMALTNQKLNPQIETVFLTTSPGNMYLSSSLVKQIAMYNGDISDFVPPCTVADIEKRLKRNNI